MYTRELVEHLLPAVWDEAAAFGIRAPYTPDDDMPKGSVNVAHGNTLGAHLADIRMAWARAEIGLPQRQALFLQFAIGVSQRHSAKLLDLSQPTICENVAEGVGRLVAWLNGDEFFLAYDPDDPDPFD